MKMGGKFPAKVIILIDFVIMTHELFRRSGVQEPHLLLDEATSGLDSSNAFKIVKLLHDL